MKIEFIRIENFLSYYGVNTFKFGSGATIIIGQNNTGKSKLFDAFRWVLYDEAFDTLDQRWKTTREWKEKLVNNFVKSQTQDNEEIEVNVEIAFKDETGKEYYISRQFLAKKLNGNNWHTGLSSEVSLTIKQINGNEDIIFDKDAANQIIKILPKNLAKYLFFQGESIDEIMSLSDRSHFNNALRDLSKIEVFEKTKKYAKKAVTRIQNDFNKTLEKNKFLSNKQKVLESEITRLSNERDRLKEDIENSTVEYNILSNRIETQKQDLGQYNEIGINLKDQDAVKRNLQSLNDQREKIYQNQYDPMIENWIYAGTQEIFCNFLSLYEENKTEKRIPEPIRQEFIKEMLSSECCHVCGRPALKDTAEFLQIKALINEKSLDKEIELIHQLAAIAESTQMKIQEIPDKIGSFYQSIENIDQQIQNHRDKLNVLEEEFKNIYPDSFNDLKITPEMIDSKKRILSNSQQELILLDKKRNQYRGRLQVKEEDLRRKEQEYKLLVEQSENSLEKEKLIFAEKIFRTAESFHNTFLHNLIKEIENKANLYFNQMTEQNQSIPGSVKINPDENDVYLIDEVGNRLENINQANRVSLQISFIAAMIAVSNDYWNEKFTFIADAPISALGGDNKIMAIQTMINIFDQSIIILKDDAITNSQESINNDPVRKLIQEMPQIGKAYQIQLQGETIEAQHTVITELK